MNEDAEISVIGKGFMVPGAEKLGEFWKVRRQCLRYPTGEIYL